MTIHEDLEEVLDTFQWAYPDRTENRGEIAVEGDELVMVVWCRDNDDEEDDYLKPLEVRVTIREGESAEDQIRSMIHQYLCHEADEQMWFGDARPFHPHAVMAS